jgi:hypothetical protein
MGWTVPNSYLEIQKKWDRELREEEAFLNREEKDAAKFRVRQYRMELLFWKLIGFGLDRKTSESMAYEVWGVELSYWTDLYLKTGPLMSLEVMR